MLFKGRSSLAWSRRLQLIIALLVLSTAFSSCKTTTSQNAAVPTEQSFASKVIGNETEKSIGCQYYDPSEADFGQSYMIKNTSWVWAENDDGNYLYVKGRKEDGFYVVDRVFSTNKLNPFSSNKTVLNSQATIEELCRRTIAKKHSNSKLFRVFVKEEKLIASNLRTQEHPAVFQDRDLSSRTSRLVIFGDSLSDTGNLWAKFRKASPKGMPAPPYFMGRFSNGPVWSDYLGLIANLAIDNWSYGGAQAAKTPSDRDDIIGTIIGAGRGIVTGSMAEYINDYINTDLTITGNVISPEKTTYLIWIGANDMLSKFDVPGASIDSYIDDPDSHEGYKTVMRRAAVQVNGDIRKLYARGARNFMIVNLPDMGITPMAAVGKPYHRNDDEAKRRSDFSRALTQMTEFYNGLLKEQANDLRNSFGDIKVAELDIFSQLRKILEGQSVDGGDFEYGLNLPAFSYNIDVPNGNPIVAYRPCFSGGYFGDSADTVCSNAAKSFFFDMVHPTTNAHCWLGYLIQRELYNQQLIDSAPDVNAYSAQCISNPAEVKHDCSAKHPRIYPDNNCGTKRGYHGTFNMRKCLGINDGQNISYYKCDNNGNCACTGQ